MMLDGAGMNISVAAPNTRMKEGRRAPRGGRITQLLGDGSQAQPLLDDVGQGHGQLHILARLQK